MTTPGDHAADRGADHPAVGLDDVIHQRVRLGVLAIVTEASRVEFRYLRDTLGLTDGNLSRHLQVLEEAGYVTTTKGFEGKRPRTWVGVTELGRDAFRAEIYALKVIVGRYERHGLVDPAGATTRGAERA